MLQKESHEMDSERVVMEQLCTDCYVEYMARYIGKQKEWMVLTIHSSKKLFSFDKFNMLRLTSYVQSHI